MSWQLYQLNDSPQFDLSSWQELNTRFCRGNPALDVRFTSLLLEYFGTGNELLGIYRDGGEELAAIVLQPAGSGLYSLFQPSQMCLAPLIHSPSADVALLLRTLLRELPSICLRLRLPKLDPNCQGVSALTENQANQCAVFGETYSIALDGEFDTYWKARSKNLRQNARRWLKRLDRDGVEIRFEKLTNTSEMARAVAFHAKLESGGWKGDRGSAIDINDDQGRFYRALLESFALSANAFAYQLYLDGTPAASILSIAAGDVIVALKIAHDHTFKQYAPGRLLDYFSLQSLFDDQRFSELDMYTRAQPSDLAWSTHTRTMMDIDVYRSEWVAHAANVAKRIKRIVAK